MLPGGAGSRSTRHWRWACRRRCAGCWRRYASAARTPACSRRNSSTSCSRTHRVVELHQLLLGGQRDRQQLAPAVGDPAGVVQPIRRREGRRPCSFSVSIGLRQRLAPWRAVRAAARWTWSSSSASAAPTHSPFGCCVGASVRRKRCRPVQRTCRMPCCSLSTSSMRASTPMFLDAHTLGARPGLGALLEAHHAERLLVAQALADQVEITRLEHLQVQQARRETAPSCSGNSGSGSPGRFIPGRPVRGAAPAWRCGRQSAGPASRRRRPSGAGRRCSRSPR